MAVLASDLVKRKKEHVFAAGYEINCATELTGAVDATSEIYHVYGDDNAIKDVTVNTGTLTLSVYDKESNNVLLDALQKIDPDDTTKKAYNWNNIYQSPVWANRFNDDNTTYERSVFYGNWMPIPAVASGDANAKGIRTFTGNCDVPQEYETPIYGEKLFLTTGASGDVGTATLAYTPQTINPTATGSSSKYAVQIIAVREERMGTTVTVSEQEDITGELDTTMITSSGGVSIDFSADCSSLTWATHVYVVYLYSAGQGVYPTVKHKGLYESITS